MFKPTLSTLVTATLWATLVSPVLAQQPPRKPAPAPVQVQPIKPPAAKPALVGDNPVVATVGGKPILWMQLISAMQSDSPDGLRFAVSQAVGTKASDAFYGPNPKPEFVITKKQALYALRENPPQPVLQALQNLIRTEQLNQEMTRYGYTLSDADLNAYLNKLLKQGRANGQIPPTQTDDEFLSQRGYTRARLKSVLRPQAAGLMLVQRDIEQNVGHPLKPDDFLSAHHILIKVAPPAADAKPEDTKKADADALAKITQIRSDIVSGKKPFEVAAKESSDDPSKDNGGDLQVFFRGMMVKEFESAAFSLKPGEISQPVRSQFGYHIIRVDKLGKDLTQDERDKALDLQKQQRLGAYFNQLNQKSKVVDYLTPANPGGQMGMMPGGPGGMRPPAPRPVAVQPRPTQPPAPRPSAPPKP